MTDFLKSLVDRSAGRGDALRPQTRALFEPQRGALMPTVAADNEESARSLTTDARGRGMLAKRGPGDVAGLPGAEPLHAVPRASSNVHDAPGHASDGYAEDDRRWRPSAGFEPRAMHVPDASFHAPSLTATAEYVLHGLAMPSSGQPPRAATTSADSEAASGTRTGPSATHAVIAVRESAASGLEPRVLADPGFRVRAPTDFVDEAARIHADRRPAPADLLHPQSTLLPPPAPEWLEAVKQSLSAAASRRDRETSDAGAHEATTEPTVRVTIGRIEVRAEAPPARSSAARERQVPQAMPLDEYLRRRTPGSAS